MLQLKVKARLFRNSSTIMKCREPDFIVNITFLMLRVLTRSSSSNPEHGCLARWSPCVPPFNVWIWVAVVLLGNRQRKRLDVKLRSG